MQVNLPELQTLLYQLVTTPDGAKRIGNERDLAPGGLEVLVRGDQRLSAIERVNIYANAYFYRLLDCLYEEFPATFAVLGSDNFEVVVRDYLLACPPTEPSIFHAADTSTLSDEAMRAIPSQQWPAIKLETHPAVAILRNEWRVTDVLCAVESGREWSQPAHQKTTVLVWRQDTQVNYRDLEEIETTALALLSEGASFAAICEAIAALATGSDQVPLIGRLLARWLGDGIIVRPDAMLRTSPITSRI